MIRTTKLPSGEAVPVLGQGTWNMGESRQSRADEVASLRAGLDLGLTLVDTAEMYADGGAEEVVADAITGRRDETFLVSKVLPYNASRRGTVAACERSLKRLRTDRLDLYLLHWPGSVPLAETLEAFQALQRAGKIRHWGVSNFDVAEMAALAALPGGGAVATNQVLYNPKRRGIESALLPRCRDRGIPIMAYSPFDHGPLLSHPELRRLASARNVTPAQLLLAWALRQDGVIAIPKTATPARVRDNRAALDLTLTAAELAALDHAFPPPTRPQPLEML